MDFSDVLAIPNPARRLEAVRKRAQEVRKDFLRKPPVRAIWSFDQISFPFLMDVAFWRANFAKNNPLHSPGILKPIAAMIDYRMYLIEDASGKRILFNPLTSDPNKIGVYQFFKEKFLSHGSVEGHLKTAGLSLSDIDVIAIDHLHLQDLTTLRPLFPNAEFLVQERELDWARNLHPIDELFFCRGGAEIELAGVAGPQEIGESLALVPTPGHTPGHQTLVLRLPEGIATIAENALSVDHYYPEDCGIDGVAGFAATARQEVIPISNTFWSAQAQYDAMILEKNLADPYMTYTSAAFSEGRRIPIGLGLSMRPPHIRRYTPRLRFGTFTQRATALSSSNRHTA